MASIRKRTTKDGDVRFHAAVRMVGFPAQAATFPKHADAKQWGRKVESEMREGRYKLSGQAETRTCAEMIDRYLKQVLPTKSKKTRYLAIQAAQLRWWKLKIGTYTLANLSQSRLAECRDELALTRAPGTVNRYLAALSHVFTIAVKEWEWLEASPVAKVRKPKEPRGRIRFLSDKERTELLQQCLRLSARKPLYLITLLALSTGARKMEIIGARWKQVDLNAGTIVIEDTKNSEPRTLHLSGVPLAKLKEYYLRRARGADLVFPARSGKQPINIDREFRRALSRARIKNFRFHDLRHTFASALAKDGATLPEIKEALGHKSFAMVSRYAHLTKSHTAGIIERTVGNMFGGASA